MLASNPLKLQGFLVQPENPAVLTSAWRSHRGGRSKRQFLGSLGDGFKRQIRQASVVGSIIRYTKPRDLIAVYAALNIKITSHEVAEATHVCAMCGQIDVRHRRVSTAPPWHGLRLKLPWRGRGRPQGRAPGPAAQRGGSAAQRSSWNSVQPCPQPPWARVHGYTTHT